MSLTSLSTRPVHVLGARGLLAGEFLRLLGQHPQLSLAGAYARQAQGTLGDAHPHLHAAFGQQRLQDADDLPAALADEDAPVLILALPHGASAPWWAQHGAALTEACPELVVVDLSADFRLESAATYEATYGLPHACPEQLGKWAYGLPELHPVPIGSQRIAVPGCFATALQLAIVPFAQAAWLDRNSPWVVHGVTGSSGSGAVAKAGTHHPHRAMNFHAYGLGGHRHEAELLSPRNGLPADTPLDFTPHSAPLSRGIHLHAVLPLAGTPQEDPLALLKMRYADAPSIEVLSQAPQVREVAGSQRVQLHAYTRGRALHVLATLDNTVKGGAGQALQALNLALGFPETLALPLSGVGY
jgi:N-acetyl-gamma-glutamyl-phosphate reductase